MPLETIYKVRGYDCGYGGPLRPLALANYLQEAAADHAAELGVGMREMGEKAITWMLSRLDLRVEALPREGEEVRVRTWSWKTDRLFALRCLELRSGGGLLLAGAVYAYLVVDLEKRRPLRPERVLRPGMHSDIEAPFPDLDAVTALGAGRDPAELESLATAPPAFSVSACPRHIDHNGHVNNGHLVDWLCDAVPADKRGGGELRRLKVEFLAEVLEGDRLEARWLSGSSALTRGAETVARCSTSWA
jgi:acyl-ACP thioesterase